MFERGHAVLQAIEAMPTGGVKSASGIGKKYQADLKANGE
jgi:hypothetical protein